MKERKKVSPGGMGEQKKGWEKGRAERGHKIGVCVCGGGNQRMSYSHQEPPTLKLALHGTMLGKRCTHVDRQA